MVKNVLIIGGSGFVGRNVYDALRVNINFKIYLASRSNGYDLRSLDVFFKLIQKVKPDYIINCAAHVGSLNYVTEKAGEVISDNTLIINNLYLSLVKANYCETIIINPIANCGYPGDESKYKEAKFFNGPVHNSVLAYGSTRRLLVQYSISFKKQYRINSINLIVPNMYGFYDSTNPNKAHALNALISKFVKAKNTNKKYISIWGTGNVIREWLYAEDFAKLINLIIHNNYLKLNQVYLNVAQDYGLSIKQLANLINLNFGNKFQLKFDNTKPDGAPIKVMDNKLFKKEFPDFTFTNFEEGIRKTIEYYDSLFPY